MLLPNVLQMYHEPRLRCRGGVSWKNIANPVMINHLPQFARTPRIRIREHQQNSARVAFTGALVSSQFSECRIGCVLVRNFCSWNWHSRAFLLLVHKQNSTAVFQSDELVPSMSQGKVPLFATPPPPLESEESSSVSVLNNKATLTSTLQTVY